MYYILYIFSVKAGPITSLKAFVDKKDITAARLIDLVRVECVVVPLNLGPVVSGDGVSTKSKT